MIHYNDEILLNHLVDFINEKNIKSLVDFGCGNGYYVSNISPNIYCEAYDLEITNAIGKPKDLSKPFKLKRKFDLVLSLEVGEHIDKESESVFINNIVNHSNKYVFMSWAIVGQGGTGHINCQNNEYIINVMNDKGFNFLETETLKIRNSNLQLPWFKNTIMIFEKI